MPLSDAVTMYGGVPADLPTPDQLADSVRALGARLTRLRTTPAAEVYNGPVLFEGAAAAELFNSVLAPRLVAVRRPVAGDAMMEAFISRMNNPFVDQIGGRVLPSFLSVSDNPTLITYQGRYLGGYHVDDDGVPARETKLVDHGILKTLLSTRVPVRGVLTSSGNRWGEGPVVTNLVVTADSGLTPAALRQRLLALAAARGKPYAVVVRRIANPEEIALTDPMAFFGAMGGEGAEAPTFQAALAVKLYADGHEEPIRAAAISGISTASFRDIVAASAAQTVYTSPSHDLAGAFGDFLAEGGGGGGGDGLNIQLMGAGSSYAASYVVPALVFEDVTLRGPSGDLPKLPLSSRP